MLQKLKNTLIFAAMLFGLLASLQGTSLAAANSATDPPCPTPTGSKLTFLHPLDTTTKQYQDNCVPEKTAADCGGKDKIDSADKTTCLGLGNGCKNSNNDEGACLKDNPLIVDLRLFVNTLSALVGIVVTGMIILGGIQYSMARDDSSAVSAARKRIANAVIALLLYMFIFAFLQWLIPGGIFN